MVLTILYILLGLSLVAVVGTLLMGGMAMASTKEKDRTTSNKWMMRRVTAQGIAILLLILTLWVKNSGG